MKYRLQFLTKDLKWQTYKSYTKLRIAKRYLKYYNAKYENCTWRVTTSSRKYWIQIDFASKMFVIRSLDTLSLL